jgi:hypothetical protein
MAGLLARRSLRRAAFPELALQWHVGRRLPTDSCGYSAGFTPVSLLALDYESTICGR